MSDFHRFTRDVIRLRRRHPALRADPITVYGMDEANRVLAFHRWVPDVGRDVVVVVSLGESTVHGYGPGFPRPGHWHEVFNSEGYDHFPNPGCRATRAESAPTAHRCTACRTPHT